MISKLPPTSWALMVLLGLTLVGCVPAAPRLLQVSPNAVPSFSAETASWDARGVRLRCPSGDCPEGVGALIFANDLEDGAIKLTRCTATLVAPDQVLTNGHCGLGFVPTRTFFFYRAGKRTHFTAVGERVFQRFGHGRDEEGLSPDLAIFRLAKPVTEVIPRTVARVTPRSLTSPIVYVVNQAVEGRSFVDLELQRESCAVQTHQPVFQGGSEDRGVGLALYDCAIVAGNSGAPVFTGGGDHLTIQAVVNALYRFANGGAVAERFFKLFETVPQSISSDFAMANRISCLELAGFSVPAATCQVRHLDELMFAPLRQAALQVATELRSKLPREAVTWEYDVIPLAIERTVEGLRPGMSFVREAYGATFVAKALCLARGTDAPPTVSLPSVTVALYQSPDGQPHAQQISRLMSEVSTAASECSGDEEDLSRRRLLEKIGAVIAE